MPTYTANPERDQDRVEDLFELFRKHRQVMFHQQKSIYWHLMDCVRGKTVLEAGCGTGQGTAILDRVVSSIVGTDKLQGNVDFAKCLYPWISFNVWDINHPYPDEAEVVVCVEAIEHAHDIQAAVKNLLFSAKEEAWISTPNGRGKPRPPQNPFHVCEYTPGEMLELLKPHEVMIRRWDNWQAVDVNTDCDPLVYQVSIRK